jgi:hypothetical protein
MVSRWRLLEPAPKPAPTLRRSLLILPDRAPAAPARTISRTSSRWSAPASLPCPWDSLAVSRGLPASGRGDNQPGRTGQGPGTISASSMHTSSARHSTSSPTLPAGCWRCARFPLPARSPALLSYMAHPMNRPRIAPTDPDKPRLLAITLHYRYFGTEWFRVMFPGSVQAGSCNSLALNHVTRGKFFGQRQTLRGSIQPGRARTRFQPGSRRSPHGFRNLPPAVAQAARHAGWPLRHA